jgi:hypothetical protein
MVDPLAFGMMPVSSTWTSKSVFRTLYLRHINQDGLVYEILLDESNLAW